MTRVFELPAGSGRERGRAHGETFGQIRPATTLVQVAGLISPEMLVEIEAEAYLD